jgi:hypothetical protein
MDQPASMITSAVSRLFVLPAIIVAATAGNAAAQSASDRSGFTVLATLGVGVQNDTALEDTSVGFAGANFGIGGFVTPDLAIMGRYSGTGVLYETGFDEIVQVSGVLAPTVQYWIHDKVNVEGGAGVGIWAMEGEADRGFGLFFGVGVTVFNRGKHNLQVGVEYAPAFTEPGTVHNFGITFGYQFF